MFSQKIISLLALFFICTSTFAEDVKLASYYPSPYGSYEQIQVLNQEESTDPDDFTLRLNKSGINIITDYSATGAYTPGIFWSTLVNYPDKPKAGIWMYEATGLSKLLFGTSNAYGTGITNNMVLDKDGNLGINTLSPISPIHASRDGGTAPMGILARYASDQTPSSLAMVRGRGTLTSPARPALNDGLAAIRFQGVNTSSQNYDGAVIQANATAAWSNTSAPTNLVFSTTAVDTIASTERIRLTEDGAVQLPGLTIAPAVSAADTGRIYYDATTDRFMASQSTGDYAPLVNTAPTNVCLSRDTGIAFSGRVAFSLLTGTRNICADANGCSYRIWVYDATRPGGFEMYASHKKNTFRQIAGGLWIDAMNNTEAPEFGTNGDNTQTEFVDWRADEVTSSGINFWIYDDDPALTPAPETNVNSVTLDDPSTANGFVVTFCDFL